MSQKFIDHATSYIDSVFTHGNTMQEAKGVADELRRQLVLKGRRPEDFIVSVPQNSIVGRTEKEAQEKYMELAQFTPSNSLHLPLFFGSAEKVASQVQQWYEQRAMDMLILRQDHPPGLRDFVDLVVPILQGRRISRTEYEADTLRGNLELPKPAFREKVVLKKAQ